MHHLTTVKRLIYSVYVAIDSRPLAGLPSRNLSRPLRPTQPGRPSAGSCSEYWRWV